MKECTYHQFTDRWRKRAEIIYKLILIRMIEVPWWSRNLVPHGGTNLIATEVVHGAGPYSHRSASSGSTRDALRAGSQHATRATNVRSPAMTTTVAGSVAVTP